MDIKHAASQPDFSVIHPGSLANAVYHRIVKRSSTFDFQMNQTGPRCNSQVRVRFLDLTKASEPARLPWPPLMIGDTIYLHYCQTDLSGLKC